MVSGRARTARAEQARRAKISKIVKARWQHYRENGIKIPAPPGAGHNKGMPAYNRGIPHSPSVIEHIRQGMQRYWKERKEKQKENTN
jgi:hypothetical protein